MAQIIVIGGQQYKKRSPWGCWGLGFITLFIYWFVWYYKTNDETRRYLADDTIKPVLSLLSQFVPIVNYVSIWNMGGRVVRSEEKAGVGSKTEPILGVVAALVAALHIVYYQSRLNQVWDAAAAGASAPSAPAVQPPPPPPPPLPTQ